LTISGDSAAYRSLQTVRFGDIDQAGIVYYPRILHFCHVAMEDFFAEVLKLDYDAVLREKRFGLPAVHVEIDFLRPLHYGDRIEVAVEVEKIGRTSVHWRYTFYRAGDDAPLAIGRTVTVGVDHSRCGRGRSTGVLGGRAGDLWTGALETEGVPPRVRGLEEKVEGRCGGRDLQPDGSRGCRRITGVGVVDSCPMGLSVSNEAPAGSERGRGIGRKRPWAARTSRRSAKTAFQLRASGPGTQSAAPSNPVLSTTVEACTGAARGLA